MIDYLSELFYYMFFGLFIIVSLVLLVLASSEQFRKTLFAEFLTSKWISEWFSGLYIEHKIVHFNEFSELKAPNPKEKLVRF